MRACRGLRAQDVFADILVGILCDADELRQVLVRQRVLLRSELIARGLGLHFHIAQHLAELVVQLARKPFAFLEHGQGPLLFEELCLSAAFAPSRRAA